MVEGVGRPIQCFPFDLVSFKTSIGQLDFLWLGPEGFVTGPLAGTSPYLDFFLENFYVHPVPWRN